MNKFDRQYLDLLQDILDHGVKKQTRAGEVLSVFDRTMRFDLHEGIPLLTTKKVFYRGCIVELLWFLSGNTNIKYLVDNNVNIWTDDAYRYYRELCEKHNNDLQYYNEGEGYVYGERKPLDKEDFIASVQGECVEQFIFRDPKDGQFYQCVYTYGDLGDVYGKQWRKYGHSGFDQIQNIIDTLRKNPDDRRMLCVAYNPDALCALNGVALPPCHVMFQFWTRELTEQERLRLVPEDELKKAAEDWTSRMDKLNIPKRELSCSFIMRSNDSPLGNPVNLSSYSILTYMIAKIVNMIPGELVYHGTDVHIYTNQIDGVKEQLNRNGSDIIPKLKFTDGKEFKEISDFKLEDFIIYDYNPDPVIKFPLSVG